MKFDITQIPPTNEALGAEANASQALLGKFKVWRGLSLGGLLVGVITVAACSWYLPWAVLAGFLAVVLVAAFLMWVTALLLGALLPTTWVVSSAVAAAVGARLAGAAPVAMVVAAAVAALLTVFAIALFTVDERCVDQKAALDALDELDPADCPQVLKWCQAHPELAAYQTQVANMQRSLVKGEAAAMREWVDSIASRAEQARLHEERQRALAALKAPLMVGAP
jgi:hypothetical protein